MLVETFEKGESVAKYIDVVTGKAQQQPTLQPHDQQHQQQQNQQQRHGGVGATAALPAAAIPNIHNSGSREEILFLSHFIVTRGEDAYLKVRAR